MQTKELQVPVARPRETAPSPSAPAFSHELAEAVNRIESHELRERDRRRQEELARLAELARHD